jgi:hypothetical protein
VTSRPVFITDIWLSVPTYSYISTPTHISSVLVLTIATVLSTLPRISVIPLLQEKINLPTDSVNTTRFKRELEKLSHSCRYQVFVCLGSFAKYCEKQLLAS